MNKERNARKIVSLLLTLLLFLTGAQAEKLTFPEGLKQIEAEAFMGDKAITSVELPNSLTTLGARAFANCKKLKAINIPASVTSLGTDFLKGCPSDVLIKTAAGSEAMYYAQENQLDYQADTKYRALLVGQSYKNGGYGLSELWGPWNDVAAMKKMLESFGGTPYSVTIKKDLSAQGMLDAIDNVFAGATEQDVSLFFYSGHGAIGTGELIGVDRTYVSPYELRQALDEIPGRKIVLVSACYSGNMIGRDDSAEQDAGSAEDFVDSFMAAFTATAKAEDLRGPEYFVITASTGSEESWELQFHRNNSRTVFAQAFLIGCGYDLVNGRNTSLYADSNGNNVITLQEAYAFTRKQALSILAPYGSKYKQYAQVYPQNCNWFGILRK